MIFILYNPCAFKYLHSQVCWDVISHGTSYISSTGRNVMRVVWVVPKPLSYECFLLLPCGPVAVLSRDRSGVKVGLSKCFLFSFKDNPMLCFQSYQVELPTAAFLRRFLLLLYSFDTSYQADKRPSRQIFHVRAAGCFTASSFIKCRYLFSNS
jgi:hypothetical protein